MKTNLIMAGFFACICMTAKAQDAKTEEPKGKAIIQVFANFHSGFGNSKDNRGFELERSYLGYEYKLNNGLSIKGVMDIGKPSSVDDYHRVAYIKNAMVSWKKGNFTLNGGLIATTQFNFQEKFWGYRYIMKSFQDAYKFGSSADLGVSANYKFTEWIAADAIIVNGEGYKKIQHFDGLNYGLGLTLTPVKGVQIRLYGGWNQSGEEGKKDIVNMAAFVGYKNDRFCIGAEYNHMLNSYYNEHADQFGYSAFASVNLPKEIALYARYDDVYSKNNWNNAKDESAAIIGAEFKLGKFVKLAPNFRMNIPKSNNKTIDYAAYINCYFGI